MDNGEGDGHDELDEDQVKRDMEICNEVQINPPQPNYYLPLEVWDITLSNINDAVDVLSCGDVCYDWEWLLHHKIRSAHHQLILPHLAPFLPVNDLLNCSALSKNWKKWVDDSVLTFRKRSTIWCVGWRPARLPQLILTEGLSRNGIEAHIEPFLEEFGGAQYDNPFVYRHVVINNRRQDENDPPAFDIFCERLLRFLLRFGHHIFQLELISQSSSIVQMIQMVSICLEHTPNLENYGCYFWVGIQWEPVDEHLVDQHIAVSPLPDSTIQKLRMINCPVKLREVVAQRYANQLIDVDNFALIPALELIPKGVTFQNLKVLRCSVRGPTFLNDGVIEVTYITTLIPLLKWTLTEVDINVFGLRLNYLMLKVAFANFLKALDQHQPQIETLKISLSCSSLEYNGYQRSGLFSVPPAPPIVYLEPVILPNLKRLTLDQVGLPAFEVFQKATPILEYLTIYNKAKYEWTFSSGHLDELWTALPKCKKILLGNVKELRFRPGNPTFQQTHLYFHKI